MPSRACIDAGPISLYYQKDPPQKIEQLMRNIKDETLTAFVPLIILVEVYKHLCVASGKDYATSCIQSFRYKFKLQFVSLTPDLVLNAGQLKCQYRGQLSYNDCVAVATALQLKATLHTTEKNLPTIRNLHVISYEF